MAAYQAGQDPTAVFGRRLLAAVVDTAIYLAITGGLFALMARSYNNVNGLPDPCGILRDQGKGNLCFASGDTAYAASGGASAVIGLVALAYVVAVYVFVQGTTGATIGKSIAGVRVVGQDGLPPGPAKALVRTLLWIADGQPCGLPLVGFITSLTTKGHRRVGDMAASTYVVGKEHAGKPIGLPGDPLPIYGNAMYPPPGAGAPPQWDDARGTYIQWDPTGGAWLQWDDIAKTWVPIR
jgi:uncharacterized RDD family membrane protein YckC